MPFAIELPIDSPFADRVRDAWTRVSGKGLGVDLAAAGWIPHVTLGVFDRIDVNRSQAALHQFRTWPPIQLTFALLGAFPTGVIFAGTVMTPALQQLHGRVHDVLRGAVEDDWEYYLPGKRVLHCTLAEKLSPEHVLAAFRLAFDTFQLPVRATVSSIRLLEFSPVRDLMAVPLDGKRSS